MAADFDYSRLSTYDGDKPYIFVSYAHKDADLVLPTIHALQQQGYRIWFDLGIEAGTEWSNNIAAHLRSCAVFLAFLSHNSVASENCLDEISFAKAKQKPSLMIFLQDDVVLPEGTEMQTARFQRMFRSRHRTQESFIQKICEATMLAPCREGNAETPPPAPEPVKKPASKSKLPLILGICGVVLVAAVVLIALLLGGGSAGMSNDLMDFTFTLEGKVYQLPCSLSEFTDEGWVITSSDYDGDTPVRANGYEYLRLERQGRSINIDVYNYSGNTRPLADCPVGSIYVEMGDYVDFSIAKGITPGASAEEVIAAFGEPDEQSVHSDYVSLIYGNDFYDSQSVRIDCCTGDEYVQYASIVLHNFVKLDSDTTETNQERPAYLDGYIAPTELGDDITSGIVNIEGDLYQLPAPVSAFLDNGWQVTESPSSVASYNWDYVKLTRNDVTVDLQVYNFAEYQTIVENCAVHCITVGDYDEVNFLLPGGLNMASTREELESLLPDDCNVDDYSYSTTYSFYQSEWEEGRDFSLYIDVSNETGLITYLSLELRTWIHG